MKNIIKVLAVVSLVTASSIVPKDWFKQIKVQASEVGKKMGLVEKTPLEKMQRGAQQMGEGLKAGWEEFTEQLPGQAKATFAKAQNKLSLLQQERDTAKRKFENARAEVEKAKNKLDSLKTNLAKAREKCKRTPFPKDIIVCRERDVLAIALTVAKGGFAAAKAVLKVSEQVYIGLLQGVEVASKAVMDAVQ